MTPVADAGSDCDSCGEDIAMHECTEPHRDCGHHCNHSWSHDACCWCGEAFNEETDTPESP